MNTSEIQQLVAEVEARAKAATEGPWQTRFIHRIWDSARKDPINLFGTKPEQDWPDADFVAHARTDIPKLIAALRELLGERTTALRELEERVRAEERERAATIAMSYFAAGGHYIAERIRITQEKTTTNTATGEIKMPRDGV